METIKKIGVGIGIGLALSAYFQRGELTCRIEQEEGVNMLTEKREEEEEVKRDERAALEDAKVINAAASKTGVKAVGSSEKRGTSQVATIPPNVAAVNRFRIAQLVSRVEQCFPNAIATISASGQQRTYGEFAKRIKRAAASFVEELGLQRGDRVAILAMNSESYLESFFSITFAGGLPVPLNIRLSTQELIEALQDCACSVLLVDEPMFSHVALICEKVSSIRRVVTMGVIAPDHPVPRSSLNLEALIETHKPLEEAILFEGNEEIPSNVYGIFYTGGTSGKAKGVMLTHEGLIVNAYTISNMVRYMEGIKYLHGTPMSHLASGTAIFGVTMMGGTHVFVPKFTPDGVLRTTQEQKITHALLVPSMFQMLLSVPNLNDYDLRSVRYFNYGGSPMPEKVLLGSMKAFPGAKFIQGYGMTEASPLITFLGAEHHVLGSPLLGSVGQCVPHGELRILDVNGKEVPRGEVGEICYRGPNVMAGYYRMPETTATTLKDGWLRTGDGGKMNEHGFVFICDRIKDTIVTGGESVYSQEVESCLLKLDGVLSCAVIGIPDPVLVEKVAAIVVVKKDSKLTEENVLEHCRARIARYKCPRVVMFRTEPLPLSGAGKVLKSMLREPFWKDVPQSNIYAKSDVVNSTYDSANGK